MSGANEQGQVIRFSVLQRVLHVLVMLGFIGLGVTGFSLKFSDQFWARGVAWILGGAPHLAWTHRFFAVVTYGAVVVHLLWLAYYKLVLKGRLTGRGTMFPGGRDFRQLGQHLKYMFAKGPLPAFGRFTYWEKLDYWAVLIGMNTMGLTGLVLWFPEWFTRFLPGHFVNLALVLHLYEAILAVALKFVVHVYTAHLRPDIYPIEKSIFNGRESMEQIRHERAGQYRELTAPDGEAGTEAAS